MITKHGGVTAGYSCMLRCTTRKAGKCTLLLLLVTVGCQCDSRQNSQSNNNAVLPNWVPDPTADTFSLPTVANIVTVRVKPWRESETWDVPAENHASLVSLFANGRKIVVDPKTTGGFIPQFAANEFEIVFHLSGGNTLEVDVDKTATIGQLFWTDSRTGDREYLGRFRFAGTKESKLRELLVSK